MADRIIPRRDTLARWAEVNPTLLEGEWGIVTDNPSLYKIGDGVTAWNDLPFRGFDGTIVQEMGDSAQSVMSQASVTEQLNTKASLNALAEAVEPLAEKNGNYPQMSVGFAENIVGDGTATEEEFSFRPTAGVNRNVETTTYDYDMRSNFGARIESVKGNSVVWNQQLKSLLSPTNTQGSITSNGITFTKLPNGWMNISGSNTTSSSALSNNTNPNVRMMANHKYFINVIGCKKSVITAYGEEINIGFESSESGIISVSSDANAYFRAKVAAGVSDVNEDVFCGITDLTQMFGAGNEPATIEEFYSLLPTNVDLNAYNEGEIVDAHYGAIKTTGFNQWDEQWEVGSINGSTGQESGYVNGIRSSNYIPVLANTKYFFHVGRTCSITVCCYDYKYNYIGTIAWGTIINRAYTTLPNTSYIKFGTFSSSGVDYGATYNNDICINLDWDEYASLNGTYAPYKPFERDLAWISQYYPEGMRRAGSAFDEIRFNSTTQKWEAVRRVGVRAYASGDESDTTLTTDGTNTNYPLATPLVAEIEEIPSLDYDVADYGTEELIVAEGVKSAPFHADIIYTPNALKTLEQVPDILRRLAALENATTTTE